MIRPAAALLFLSACVYQFGRPLAVSKVRLGIFDTKSERRLHEFDLTAAVARELSAAGVRVNAPDAEHELVGEIADFEQPAVVVDDRDVPIVGSVAITLRVRLVERSTGKVLWEDQRVEQAEFSNRRLESTETARREVFDRLARWVATKFESDW